MTSDQSNFLSLKGIGKRKKCDCASFWFKRKKCSYVGRGVVLIVRTIIPGRGECKRRRNLKWKIEGMRSDHAMYEGKPKGTLMSIE